MGEKSKIFLMVFLLLVIFVLLIQQVEAKESSAIVRSMAVPPVVAHYPDKINIFEPFTVELDFVNKDYRKKVKSISIGRCSIPFEEVMGFSKSQLKWGGRNSYEYNGEKKVKLKVSAINSGKLEHSTDSNGNLVISCDIYLDGKNISSSDYVPITMIFNDDFDVGSTGIPVDFTKRYDDKYGFTKAYERKDSADIDFKIQLFRFDNRKENWNYFTFDDLKKVQFTDWNSLDDFTKELLDVNGKPAPIAYKCEVEKTYEDKFKGWCSFNGHVIMPSGPVVVNLDAKQINVVDSEAEMQHIFSDWKTLYLNILENVYLKSNGKNSDFIIDETDDNECGNCKEGFVCGACGNCIKESKAYDLNEIFTSIDPKITQSSEKIENAITSKVLFKIYPNLKLKTKRGKKISYCDLKAPGFTGEVEAKVENLMDNNTPYSGFTQFGRVTEKRKLETTCKVDFTESKPSCSVLLQPNDMKKFVVDAKDTQESISFNVNVNGQSLPYIKFVTLTPPDFKIKFKSSGHQVQQGSSRSLKITTKGATTKAVILKTTLLGPGGIGTETDKLNRHTIISSLDSNKYLTIGYKAPPMGNFDIGKELKSLSMKQLQKEAAIQIAEDTFMAYSGNYVGNLEKLVDSGRYVPKFKKFTEAFKLANGAKTLRGINDGIEGQTKEFGDAMGVTKGKKSAGFMERIADAGITGISIAQTTVSVVTFLPNKLPGVGKLTAGVQAAFSAATNIWKANLKYISKSEKIERAQELFYPAVIVVTVQDISGWTIQDMFTFKVMYQQID